MVMSLINMVLDGNLVIIAKYKNNINKKVQPMTKSYYLQEIIGLCHL